MVPGYVIVAAERGWPVAPAEESRSLLGAVRHWLDCRDLGPLVLSAVSEDDFEYIVQEHGLFEGQLDADATPLEELPERARRAAIVACVRSLETDRPAAFERVPPLLEALEHLERWPEWVPRCLERWVVQGGDVGARAYRLSRSAKIVED